jgi:hypothetical protein
MYFEVLLDLLRMEKEAKASVYQQDATLLIPPHLLAVIIQGPTAGLAS